jgi:hypothetical protein
VQGDVRQGVAALLKCQHSHCANLQFVLPQQADLSAAGADDESATPLLPAAALVPALQPRTRFNLVVLSLGDAASSNVGLQATLKADPHLTRCAQPVDCQPNLHLHPAFIRAQLCLWTLSTCYSTCGHTHTCTTMQDVRALVFSVAVRSWRLLSFTADVFVLL